MNSFRTDLNGVKVVVVKQQYFQIKLLINVKSCNMLTGGLCFVIYVGC